MRKIRLIAWREYLAAVKTKTFIISLLVMPLLGGGGALFSFLFRDVTDTQDRHFVIVDRTQDKALLKIIEMSLTDYNEKRVFDAGTQLQVRPHFIYRIEPGLPDIKQQRFELSDRVRKGQLMGFLEISQNKEIPGKFVLRYQTNRTLAKQFPEYVERTSSKVIQDQMREEANLNKAQLQVLLDPIDLELKGLTRKNPRTGELEEPSPESILASVVMPPVLMLLMFSVVFMAAGPLLQSVVEEKMQRVAEVLLGSVRPFELMMGKLLGLVGVSMTIEAVYLACLYVAARYFGIDEFIPADLIVWFVVFQALAALMFGSLFLAVGAVCTDMKDTQNLLLPVVLLAALPLFLLANIMQEPNSPLAVGLSFFPFATPSLMIARQAVPPGVPMWQGLVGGLLVLVTVIGCVWAAGRLFRVGLLLQSKPPSFRDLVRWVLRG